MGSFCNIYTRKKIMKCISQNENKCYLFVGRLGKIYPQIKKIINNKKEDKDIFEGIIDKNIIQLYEYIQGIKDTDDIEKMKQKIIKELYLNDFPIENIEIVYESLYEDETNEVILNKISFYCLNNTFYPYIYVWCYDDYKNKNLPIGFEYESDKIEYIDFFDKKPSDVIDTNFINSNGDRIPNQILSHNLELFENNNIRDNVLYFFTLPEYLKQHDLYDKLLSLNSSEIQKDRDINTIVNGVLLKYWNKLNINDILILNNEEQLEKMLIQSKKNRSFIEKYNSGIIFIEKEFLQEEVNKKIQCKEYTISILKINREASIKNTVHLSKLFAEFELSNTIPFTKLLLDSHDDAFYKIYEGSLQYSGIDKTETRHITKGLCKEWCDGHNIQTEYGYKYLHSGNIIMFKIYNPIKDIFCSLVIKLNGDIECIIENNKQEMYEEDIKELIHKCNSLIRKINKDSFYSFNDIIEFNEDIFTDIHSETKIDFLNSALLFSKEDFQVKGNVFPQWRTYLNSFMINFSMYFRVKPYEETDDLSKIIARYKRVNNFANLTTIQSAISIYQMIYDDQEVVIEKISHDYGQDPEYIRTEVEVWNSLMKMKPDPIRRSKVIKESGSEIAVWLTPKEDLIVDISNIKSFNEQRRVVLLIKTMLNMYLSYIKGNTKYSKYFRIDSDILKDEVKVQISESDESSSEEEEEEDEGDDLISRLLSSSSSSDFDSDSDSTQKGGANGVYETKSYYLKRLKDYDPDLFKFQSKKIQGKSGVRYGYAKLCGAVDNRQPIAVTDEDLDRINKSYDQGSGRESYSFAITVPRRSSKIKYICPKYWDISKSLSIRPDAEEIKDGTNIIPKDLPKGSNGRTDKYILERTGNYWRDASTVKYLIPEIREESHQLHPKGYGLPCCFNDSKPINSLRQELDGIPIKSLIRKAKEFGIQDEKLEPIIDSRSSLVEFIIIEDQKKRHVLKENKEKRIDPMEGYISNKDPVNEGKYAHLHPYLMKYFDQNSKFFSKKTAYGFLKIGVQQNNNEYIFDNSPFLQSYFKILTNGMIKKDLEQYSLNELIENLEKNIKKFQKCSIIHQKFRKNIEYITKDDIKYIIELLKKETTQDFIKDKNIINELSSELEKGILSFKKIELNYFFQLLLSLKNYIDFLNSNENRDDGFILPLLLRMYDINIVIFENREDEINIKVTEYSDSKKMGFIYKRGNIYEPILYRHYDTKTDDKVDDFIFESDKVMNGHYEIIIDNIYQKINERKKESMIETYRKVIHDMDDEIIKLFINSYSEVSYLITREDRLIPIPPIPIPSKGNYEMVYSFSDFIDLSSIKAGMDVNISLDSVPKEIFENGMEVFWRVDGKKVFGTIEEMKGKGAFVRTEEGKKMGKPLNKLSPKKLKATFNNILTSEKGDILVSVTWNKTKYELNITDVIFINKKGKTIHKLPSYQGSINTLKNFEEFKIDSLITNQLDNVIHLYLSNNTYLPILETKITGISYKRRTNINLLELDSLLSNIKNDDNDCVNFINSQNYEEYITRLSFYHLLNIIDNQIFNVEGYLKDTEFYRIGDTIHFTSNKEIINGNNYQIINKIDKLENLYSQFDRDNYVMTGEIIDIQEDESSGLSKIVIEVRLLDIVTQAYNDTIIINQHKRFRIYEILDPFIKNLFEPLEEKKFKKESLSRYISLCINKKGSCEYPCTGSDGKCKLYVKEFDYFGNRLIEKIKCKFIEKLLITGIENRMDIIEEKINLNDLKKTVKNNEIFYTYSEYKENKLDEIFIRKSKFIHQLGKNIKYRKRHSLMKKMDTIPYLINRNYGKEASVLFHLNKKNNDFLAIEKALNESGIPYDVEGIKLKIIDKLRSTKPSQLIQEYKKFNKKYKNIEEIVSEIEKDDYRIEIPEIKILLQILEEEGNQLGIYLISQKYNLKKENEVYYESTSNVDKETTPIISFYHTYYQNEYVLSNILTFYQGIQSFYTNTRSLIQINKIHETWIK